MSWLLIHVRIAAISLILLRRVHIRVLYIIIRIIISRLIRTIRLVNWLIVNRILLRRRGIRCIYLWLMLAVEHFLESIKEFPFINWAIGVLVDGANGLNTLLFGNGWGDSKLSKEIVKEVSQLILIESATFISIILVKYFVDICLEHLILEIECHCGLFLKLIRFI